MERAWGGGKGGNTITIFAHTYSNPQ